MILKACPYLTWQQMQIINDSYIPHPPVAAFHAAPEHSLHQGIRYSKGIMHPKGEGGTTGVIKEILALCTEFAGYKCWIFRLDYESHKKSTIDYLYECIPKELIIGYDKPNRGYDRQDHVMRIKTKDPDKPSTIWLLHGKVPKGMETAQVGCALFLEADEMPYEVVKTAASRVRQPNVPLYLMFDYNPPPKSHWLYRYFEKEPKEKPELRKTRKCFFIPAGTNKKYLPKGHYDQLEELYPEGTDEYKRYVLGEYGSITTDLAVWQQWRSSLHITETELKPIVGVPIVRCWDFDFRAACVLLQMVDQRVRILYPEVWSPNKGVDEFVPYALDIIMRHYSDFEFKDFTDPSVVNKRGHISAAQTTKSIARQYNVHLDDGLEDWVQRQRVVNYFLTKLSGGKPQFEVDSRNDMIIEGFEGEYRYKKSAVTRTAKDVDKTTVHASLQDCIQHGCGYYYDQLHDQEEHYEDIPEDMYDFEADYEDHSKAWPER
ncbi:MAG: hypothetical protein GY861_08315 [bacterium]|nr:hypothetical protein [bacterium]